MDPKSKQDSTTNSTSSTGQGAPHSQQWLVDHTFGIGPEDAAFLYL
jgi:hypothetical protein